YLSYRQIGGMGMRNMTLALRSERDPQALVSAVRRQVQSLDPALPVSNVRLMDDVLALAQSRPRFLAVLLSMFSVIALSIATVGIYGVISYSVARRTREFGLRMVLGARPRDVLGLVLKQGGRMTMAGIAAGVIAAFGLTRL